LLAEFPSEHRDEARLMVIDRKKQTIEHKTFKDVIDYFDDGDVLILNNTKVFPHVCTGNKEKQEQESKFFYLEN
jgi:S-adenosylmethionine:tRNA ribosyltransferase-isomerase